MTSTRRSARPTKTGRSTTGPATTGPATTGEGPWASWPTDVTLCAYVGTDKAGSTWLHSRLASVPGAQLSPAKDLYFFDKNYARGVGWYQGQFPIDAETRTVFDISHDYLYSTAALQRLVSCPVLGQVLVSLREPADRAISAYYYAAAYQKLPTDFWAAVDRVPEIVKNSFYGERLDVLMDLVGPERIKVQAFEQLKTEPAAFLNGFVTAAGLSPVCPTSVDIAKARQSRESRNLALSRMAKHGAQLARRAGSPAIVGRVKNLPAVESLLFREREQSLPNEEDLRAELRDFFARDRAQTLALAPQLAAWWSPEAS